MNNKLNLTPTQALGVAISVLKPCGHCLMDECQELAPDMLEHLRRMGFKLVPYEREVSEPRESDRVGPI